MNIEEQVKIVKNMLLHAETQLLDYEALAIETLLTAYEKEKEENKQWKKYVTNNLEKQITERNNKIIELEAELEKEKEKNKEKDKFEKILADDLKIHIASITIGKSITFPCGWVYKQDLLNLIDDIEWK